MNIPETISYALTYRATARDMDADRRTAAFEKLSGLFNVIQQKEGRFRAYTHYQGWPFISKSIHLDHADRIDRITIDNPARQDLAYIRLLGFSVALDEENEAGFYCL